jgi:chitodextrinase
MLHRRSTFIQLGLVCLLAAGLLVVAGARGPLSAQAAVADSTPPSVPDNMAQSGTTQTSFTFTWSPSTDNVKVAGYDLFRNGTKIGTTTGTTYTYTGLTCGTTHTVALQAFDAAGNRSNAAAATGPASTSACAASDTTPPSAPDNMAQSGTTQTSFTFTWSPSTDNVKVAGYDLFRNGTKVGTTTGTTYTYTGLTCGTTYTVALQAFDAAGNRSNASAGTGSATTSACAATGDTAAPSAPSSVRTTSTTQTSVALAWNASTDNVGVSGYGVYNGAASSGSTSATTYTVSGLACGSSYSLGVDAFDAAGNRSTKATVNATTAACSSSGTANFYISPAGSDSNACSQAAPCKTFARGYAVASPGQVVEAAGGYYGCGSINGTKTADVTIRAAAGSTPWVTCELSLGASHLALENVNIAGLRMSFGAQNDTLRNVNITCLDQSPFPLYGGKCSAGIFGTPTNFTMLGGSVGPTMEGNGSAGNSQIGIPYGGGPGVAKNLVFDGVRFHDNRRVDATQHTECLMVGGGDGVTIRNSRFDHCAVFGIFDTWWNFVSPQYAPAKNVLYENNVFAPNVDGCIAGCAGNSGEASIKFASYPPQWENITVRYNTMDGVLLFDSTPTYINAKVEGNLSKAYSFDCPLPAASYLYNVTWNGHCGGTTNKQVTSAGFVNEAGGDYHPTATSPAINSGNPGDYPTRDYAGGPRPLGGAPDAGAYEMK